MIYIMIYYYDILYIIEMIYNIYINIKLYIFLDVILLILKLYNIFEQNILFEIREFYINCKYIFFNVYLVNNEFVFLMYVCQYI